MDADFWHQRWSENRIGFHQDQVTPLLRSHWSALALDRKTPVFVPLCGKSQDLIWLNQQGHPVQGVELSRAAVAAFAEENQLNGTWHEQDGFESFKSNSIQIWVADIFALSEKQLGPLHAIFDRAALIALPPNTRQQYSQHLSALAAPNCKQLLICLEYEQSKREGPPFSVLKREIETLYPGWQIEPSQKTPIVGKQPPSYDSAYFLQRQTSI